MKRRWIIPSLGAVFVLLLVFFLAMQIVPGHVARQLNTMTEATPPRLSRLAASAHGLFTVVDLHNDLLLWNRDPLRRARYGHTDVPRLIEGNVALQVFSVVTKTPRGQNYERNTADSDLLTPLMVLQGRPPATWTSLTARALHQARALHDAARRSNGLLTVIRSAADLDAYLARRAQFPEMTAGLLALEGLHVLEGRRETLDRLYDAGFRMMGLTHFFDNDVAGSAHGVEKGGLMPFGEEILRAMEEKGIVVDLAHASPATIDDVLRIATKPVVVSHGGVQATCPGPRNLTDDQIRGIAATGGVIGIGFWDGAVCEPTPEHIVRAIRHVHDLVGIEPIALGSDWDGATTVPFDASRLVVLTDALIRAGFGEQEIRRIMGENALRVLRATLPA